MRRRADADQLDRSQGLAGEAVIAVGQPAGDAEGAIVTAHAVNGWLFSNAGGGWEFPAFWAATLVVQALLGDGAFALKLPSPVRLVAAAQS
jgi:hypothetical protein